MFKIVTRHVFSEFASQLHHVALRGHQFHSHDIAPGDAIFDCFAAACVFSDIAAEETGFEAHGVASIEEPSFFNEGINIIGNDASFSRDSHIRVVNLEYLVHFFDGEQNAAIHRDCSSGETAARAARSDGNELTVSQLYYGRDFGSCAR
ncbi:MAG: hypothetical protein DDT20_01543 [Firmicutes bacterium]|nr:hypothetical protein [Bacillota bacterium]